MRVTRSKTTVVVPNAQLEGREQLRGREGARETTGKAVTLHALAM